MIWMHPRFLILQILLLGLLTGCIPMSATYLKPSSTDKSLILNAKPACGGEQNSIFIYPDQRDWIRVQVFAVKDFQNPKSIRLFAYVQKSLGLGFFHTDEEIKLLTERTDKVITIVTSNPVITVKSQSETRQLPMSAFDESNEAMTTYSLLLGSWVLASDFPEGFVVEMPDLVVDGVKMTFAPIHFTLTHEIVNQALNC